MLFILWKKILANGAVIGAALLAVLAFIGRLQFLKNARDKAQDKAEVLGAQLQVTKAKEKIIKEEEKKEESRRDSIKEEVKKLKEKDVESFKGIDNLSNPNKF